MVSDDLLPQRGERNRTAVANVEWYSRTFTGGDPPMLGWRIIKDIKVGEELLVKYNGTV